MPHAHVPKRSRPPSRYLVHLCRSDAPPLSRPLVCPCFSASSLRFFLLSLCSFASSFAQPAHSNILQIHTHTHEHACMYMMVVVIASFARPGRLQIGRCDLRTMYR